MPMACAASSKQRGGISRTSVSLRRLQLAAQAIGIVHVMDGAEIDLGVRRPQLFERREKRFVRGAERRQMQKINAPARRRHHRIEQDDTAADIGRLAQWPAAQRAEAAEPRGVR